MSCFTSQVNGMAVSEPDPTKHVNYNLGMVLGVDDFTQEFAYLSGRDQWMARDLIGYGTARGLKVTVGTDVKGPRVMVEPGVAVSPKGQMICVPSAQCAYLNQWLAANAREVNEKLQSPLRSDLKIYVVLCYRHCETDKVPIPGEPCRSEEDLTAPSRLSDDFQLELRFEAPNQREEEALRDFVAWFRLIQISDSVVSPDPMLDFEAAIREAARPWLSPLTSSIDSPLDSPPSDFMFGSPPATLQIPASEAIDYMRAAFRIWTTELRPKWIGRWHGCVPDRPGEMSFDEENCVMLAALNIPVLPASPGGDFVVDDSPIPGVEVDESKRPSLVHLRMLQEWLLVREHQDRQVSPSDDVVTETEFGKVESAGTSSAYSRADHTHGTPALPDLSGDVVGSIAAATVGGIQGVAVAPTAPTNGQALMFSNADSAWKPTDLPSGDGDVSLNGDVVGSASDTTVQALQKTAVAATTPADKQVLTFDSAINSWTPADPSPAPIVPPSSDLVGDVVGPLGANQIDNIQTVPIDLPRVDLVDGRVLTIRDSRLHLEEPAPQTTPDDVVEHPKGLGQYLIVAAGTVRGDGTSPVPSYNELAVRRIDNGLMVVTFRGYRPPDDTFQYVVKVLPKANDRLPMPIVTFERFFTRDLGFALRVVNGDVEVLRETLESLELMIEVSQYFVRT
jgi:hypothetical protein